MSNSRRGQTSHRRKLKAHRVPQHHLGCGCGRVVIDELLAAPGPACEARLHPQADLQAL